MEAGNVAYSEQGTPQGGVISPLLSNIYLHEVLDRWFVKTVQPLMKGKTFSAKKEGGTKTELWIKRSLEHGGDIPGIIEELTITAQLLRDKYEYRYYGMFRITLTRLVLLSDETAVDSADAVIGPLRYYVAGTVNAEVFTNSGETLE
jgi:hypothetical protein